MDNGYRFGRIEVTCEGYSHSSDPYILKGSCGLEYTLELTKEGRKRNHGSWSSHKSGGFEGRSDKAAQRVSFTHNSCSPGLSLGLGDTFSGFFSSFFGKKDHHYHQQPSHQSSYPSDDGDSGSLLVILVLLLFAFGIYKLFLSPNASHDGSNHDSHSGYQRDHRYGSNTGPPPAGFKPDYTGSTGSNSRPIPQWIGCRNYVASFWLFCSRVFRVSGFQPRLRFPHGLHSGSAVPRQSSC